MGVWGGKEWGRDTGEVGEEGARGAGTRCWQLPVPVPTERPGEGNARSPPVLNSFTCVGFRKNFSGSDTSALSAGPR